MPEPNRKPAANATLRAYGKRVRAARVQLGWSQERAAHEIGVHWTYLGQVERGHRSSRIENIVRFAAGLKTTPGALLDGLPVPED
ncbi:helix-turn-helix transcriptional regulator [Nocardia puris]|uniref:helix-turn-helix domain-containing protein n=1 Tax=Nocardia puris TaxID=208602 RepID=UPI0018936F07|nr:helix-turn-helix transcriptional regulator [Nocardia puris]MBF6210704.1 helix-turn-helix transcriptional regulator [Nocardia puris]